MKNTFDVAKEVPDACISVYLLSLATYQDLSWFEQLNVQFIAVIHSNSEDFIWEVLLQFELSF
jgi:hypothetical protein